MATTTQQHGNNNTTGAALAAAFLATKKPTQWRSVILFHSPDFFIALAAAEALS